MSTTYSVESLLFSWMTGNSDMHYKNFSLIDTGSGEYTLSPAYDLFAVLIADPADTEEMAMRLVSSIAYLFSILILVENLP